MLEVFLIVGFMFVGCDVIIVGIILIFVVVYLIRKYGVDCGVVIFVFYNFVEYNGIKFFNKNGYKLDDEIELKIEEYIDDIDKIDCFLIGENVGRKLYEYCV